MENVTRRTNEQLAELIQKGHTELYEELWDNVSDLINQLAWVRYSAIHRDSGSIVSNEDFAQSGFIALVEAVRYFEPDGEYKFTTYLSNCLKTAFAEATGTRTSRRDALRYSASLDAPLDDTGEFTLYDVAADPSAGYDYDNADERLWREELRATLDKAVCELAPRQREMIFRRYVFGQTQKEIGEYFGTTGNAVRETERAAYRELQRNAKRNGLEKFLDERCSFFTHVGVNTFNRTHTSAVELTVLKRETLEDWFLLVSEMV